ncbi:ABC transporter substrate binding protein, partial [Desulfobacterales bacterium HSG2]|nr:ABC transporter substrate binding protein [Desulfobacterales bacterium HSG2]
IGGKAYFFAREHLGEKKVVFSSIINWLRLPGLSGTAYGVSNELHPRMPIYMFRSVFPDIKRIGMLYSMQYTSQWFENAKGQAGELEIEIIGRTVSREKQTLSALNELLPNIDALWLISDPSVMSKKDYLYKILKRCDASKTPVFSYHGPFAKLGATLIVSADMPTIGRQAANIAMGVLSGEEMEEKVQFPAGSHIVLNLKKVKMFGLKYNKDALGLINTIIK